MPKLSIVTPCFNSEGYLPELIESVRRQTFSDWEQIIVDDGSTDLSGSIAVEASMKDPRIRVVHQPNRGVCQARNAGFLRCNPGSEYVYFLDADDCLEPRMLETMIGYLDAHTEVGIAFCHYTCINENGRPVEHPNMPRYVPSGLWVRELAAEEPNTPFVSIYCWAPVMEGVSVLRRSVYQRTAGWDAALGQYGEGVDLFLQMALLAEVHFVPVSLYRYRRHSSQCTAGERIHKIQERKVYSKWDRFPCLTVKQQKLVRAARSFRFGRLPLYQRFRAAGSLWQSGRRRMALRLYGSAVYRYVRWNLALDQV
jgi:glycosyltransferase involved in cell wall biosynthesis